MCMCAWVFICAPHACNTHVGQKKTFYALEPELRVIVTCLMWVLETKHRSFARVARTLNHWAIYWGPKSPLTDLFTCWWLQLGIPRIQRAVKLEYVKLTSYVIWLKGWDNCFSFLLVLCVLWCLREGSDALWLLFFLCNLIVNRRENNSCLN